MLVETIGKPAMLEQTAEEATELAQACLKLSRLIRDENPVYKSKTEIVANLHEEIADCMICINELINAGLISHEGIDSQMAYKEQRMKTRFSMEERTE